MFEHVNIRCKQAQNLRVDICLHFSSVSGMGFQKRKNRSDIF